MTNVQEKYEGDFLEGENLEEGKLVPAVIEAVADPDTEKDASGKLISKAIVTFKGKKKRLILNKTNYLSLRAMFGGDPKEWIGKEIKLQRRYLSAARAFGNHNQPSVRIIPPTGTPVPKKFLDNLGSKTPLPQN